MIPILYDTNETEFSSNGLGRLRDMISCVVTEERNGVYELDFEYPIDGANFDLIKVGRIIGATHDESDDVQPFDIVSYSRPINGVVTFHCTHISYRQSYMTVTGSNINSLASAFTLFASAQPDNPFSYQSDKVSTGYMASADGVPHSVRQMLGGIEGSILDTYGGEYEWDKFTVILHSSRGTDRDFAIRYGVNMLDYNEEYDISGTYSSCIPYWKDDTITIIGDRQDSGNQTVTGRGECVPLDVTDKFENQPTKAQVEAMGASIMAANDPSVPVQNIHVEFIRLQDMPEYAGFSNLFQCKLCDTINVIFPDYETSARFKIVKTVWDVLADRYESMELGDLSVTLAEALGVSSSTSGGTLAPGWFYAKDITATTISSTNSYVKVPITAIGGGEGFSYDSTNKGIKCNKSGTYVVSMQLQLDTATDGDLIGVAIYNNGTIALGPAYMRVGGTYASAIMMPTVINLQASDVLTVYIRNNTASRGATGTGCRLMCWEIG